MADDHGEQLRAMFDRISRRYDLLNRLLSAGHDMRWRRRAARLLGDLSGKTVLDVCCGTGDFLRILRDRYGSNIRLCGADFTHGMLRLADSRLSANHRTAPFLCRADARSLPFADDAADAVTVGFGIRNIVEKDAALRDIFRVLAPGGRLVIVEPSIPQNPLAAALFLFYFKRVMPRIGGLVSGDYTAYKYLNDSVAAFPSPDQFLAHLAAAGFVHVTAYPQLFGTAMIYYGEKP